jgi:hypothetical protein
MIRSSMFHCVFEQGWFVPSIAELKELIVGEKLGRISLTRQLRNTDEQYDRLVSSSMVLTTGNPTDISFWSWQPTADKTGTTEISHIHS